VLPKTTEPGSVEGCTPWLTATVGAAAVVVVVDGAVVVVGVAVVVVVVGGAVVVVGVAVVVVVAGATVVVVVGATVVVVVVVGVAAPAADRGPARISIPAPRPTSSRLPIAC
jgi:hypothetical protein